MESMMLSEATGSRLIFTRPISILLIVLTVLSSAWPLIQSWKARRRGFSKAKRPLHPGGREKSQERGAIGRPILSWPFSEEGFAPWSSLTSEALISNRQSCPGHARR